MKIKIKRLKIKENPANEVTSHKVLASRRTKDINGNFVYHSEGIFSDKIFGRFGKCKCGELTKPGYCSICETRVISSKRIPDFYVSFNGVRIPFNDIDYSIFGAKAKEAETIINYEGFIYNGEFVQLNLDKIEDEYEGALIGEDAIVELGGTKEWYEENTTDKFSIPHTTYRPIIKTPTNKLVLGPLNDSLIDLLRKKAEINSYLEMDDLDTITLLVCYNSVIKEIKNIRNEIFDLIAKNKNSVINKEVRGQDITGAARAVVTNNFDLDEDIALIGDYFIPVLYPVLSEKFKDELTGKIDIHELNKHLMDNGYRILVNRAPTIGEKSIMGMIPQFSENPNERYVLQLNPILFDGFAGDTDGDVFLMIALYTRESHQEADSLLPSRNFLGGDNSEVRNKLPEDFVYVMKKAYETNHEIKDKIRDIILGRD